MPTWLDFEQEIPPYLRAQMVGPLEIVVRYTQLLLQTHLTSEQRHFAQLIARSGEFLKDVLHLSSPQPDGSTWLVPSTAPRILLAEPEAPWRHLVSAMLERLGCGVDAVSCPEDLQKKGAEGHYDLFLADLRLLEEAGHQCALPSAVSSIPVIAMVERGAIVEAVAVDDVIEKPVGSQALRHSLASCLASQARQMCLL